MRSVRALVALRAAALTLLATGGWTTAALAQDQREDIGPAPAFLISFDGLNELAAAASRVGMLSQVLTYTLTVGPDGKPTDCEFNRKFRRKYVQIALCRPLMKHHTFEPARDASGAPVEGRYSATIDFRMFFNSDGSSKARDY